MKAFIRSLLALSVVFLLAACGEGWDMQPYSEREPYTMERTAGSGIEYVRGAMMSEKGAVLDPATDDHVSVTKTESIEQDAPPSAAAEEAKDEAIVQEADHIFTAKQKK